MPRSLIFPRKGSLLRQLRTFLSWLFALTSLTCFLIVARYLQGVLHALYLGQTSRILRQFIVPSIMFVMAVVLAMGWWTAWRETRSSQAWGIAASLMNILVGLFPLFMYSRYQHFHFRFELLLGPGLIIMVGAAGLVAFSRPCPSLPDPADKDSHHPIPGDGTNEFLNKAYGLGFVILSFGAYCWWGRWCWDRGISTQYGGALQGFLWLTLAALAVACVHELGHTLTGLALGMRLRAFAVGPFEWCVRTGKWEFQFKPGQILAIGGATGVVPVSAHVPGWQYVCITAAGPLMNLITGMCALLLALFSDGHSPVEARGALAVFGVFSVTAFFGNVVPFRAGNSYSDGAQMYQLLSGGPWGDYHKAISVVASSAVTPLRPRDYDIEILKRASDGITQGIRGMLLRLIAYHHFLDSGQMDEARAAFKQAESIYDTSASELTAGLLTVFVFGSAYLFHDAAAARLWWDRMEAKKPTRFDMDYWRAKSALCWIEGDLNEANEAWQKADVDAQSLPSAGAYDFDRHCCGLLRTALDECCVVAG